MSNQIVYPIADTYVGNWTGEGGETSNLYTHIDETSANDSDFVKSENDPSASPVVFQLGSLDDPGVGTAHVLSYHYGKELIDGSGINLTVQIRQDYVNEGSQGTLIAEWVHSDIGTVINADGTLSAAQAGSITDYTSLFIRFVADTV